MSGCTSVSPTHSSLDQHGILLKAIVHVGNEHMSHQAMFSCGGMIAAVQPAVLLINFCYPLVPVLHTPHQPVHLHWVSNIQSIGNKPLADHTAAFFSIFLASSHPASWPGAAAGPAGKRRSVKGTSPLPMWKGPSQSRPDGKLKYLRCNMIVLLKKPTYQGDGLITSAAATTRADRLSTGVSAILPSAHMQPPPVQLQAL
jgi:hypothetical protein